MSELELYIKSYFGVVSENDLKSIVSLFNSKTILKGEYFLKTGNKCDKLSFVQSGLLRIFVQTQDKEVTQWISEKVSCPEIGLHKSSVKYGRKNREI
ncbi:MAG: hypothetical protein EAZ53_05885 [Bacteroidetes bacterium]|nr:MAG: hypothetical protein EAZ53_05885 [Bacteroidota bacterium]